jgi:hypothetical protein
VCSLVSRCFANAQRALVVLYFVTTSVLILNTLTVFFVRLQLAPAVSKLCCLSFLRNCDGWLAALLLFELDLIEELLTERRVVCKLI